MGVSEIPEAKGSAITGVTAIMLTPTRATSSVA
jgi:hypothetical protein